MSINNLIEFLKIIMIWFLKNYRNSVKYGIISLYNFSNFIIFKIVLFIIFNLFNLNNLIIEKLIFENFVLFFS